jgi:hypothetical protein
LGLFDPFGPITTGMRVGAGLFATFIMGLRLAIVLAMLINIKQLLEQIRTKRAKIRSGLLILL